jgi:hypothetical protein
MWRLPLRGRGPFADLNENFQAAQDLLDGHGFELALPALADVAEVLGGTFEFALSGFRGANEPRAPIDRIGDAFDVAELDQLGDELTHGLVTHLRTLRKRGESRTRAIEVFEYLRVACAHAAAAFSAKPRRHRVHERRSGSLDGPRHCHRSSLFRHQGTLTFPQAACTVCAGNLRN